MQPNKRLRKTVLAGAFILSAGNAFNASAELFPVTAGAIPDVDVQLVSGHDQLSFGNGVIGNKVGSTCSMNGITGIPDDVLLWDVLGNDTLDTTDTNFGLLTAADPLNSACLVGNGEKGTPVVIEIDGANTSTVTVTVDNFSGSGYTYTPTDESCVVDFSGDNSADNCVSLENNVVSNVGMSAVIASDGSGTVENTGGVYEFSDMSGKTRMVLAGEISIDSEIAAGATINENIIVKVTYE